MKKIKGRFKKFKDLWVYGLCFFLFSVPGFSESVIPISNDDQTSTGTDFSATVMHILQKDILPFVEVGGAAILLFTALNGLWKGYKEYQRERDMDPLKQAVMASVIAIVVGGAILFLIDALRIKTFG